MSEEVKKEVAPAAPAADAAAPAAEGEAPKAKKSGKSIPAGIAFIRSTFNNTQVSIADARGGVISWSSAGKAGFKGSRKSTAFAASLDFALSLTVTMSPTRTIIEGIDALRSLTRSRRACTSAR